jgi:hypothetical protein
MKRNRLVEAIAGTFFVAASAHAVSLSSNGIGEVLFYPYYTVNKGQDTLVSLVNSDRVNGKVVKVRFKEGYNGRVVMDLDVFLSPADVWTAAVTQVSADGGVLIRTSDRTCTLPVIPADGLAFVSSGYDGSAQPGDDGPHDITRTREGSIEVITAGDLVYGTTTYSAIAHVQTGNAGEGQPPGCATLDTHQIAADITAPTNALFGSGSIVNVGTGIFFGYAATAIRDFSAIALFDPENNGPTLDQANTAGVDGARAYISIVDAETPVVADYTSGVDAVSAALMSGAFGNEYFIDPSLGALTDWIISYPTKSFYVDKLLYPENQTNPFFEPFLNGASSVPLFAIVFDREEGYNDVQCPATPPPGCGPAEPITYYQVNAISIREPSTAPQPPHVTSDVFGSALVSSATPWGTKGWLYLNLASGDGGDHSLSAGDSVVSGLPAIGFMAYDIVNASAQPGLLANYSGLFPHRSFGASCTSSTQGPCTPIGTAIIEHPARP